MTWFTIYKTKNSASLRYFGTCFMHNIGDIDLRGEGGEAVNCKIGFDKISFGNLAEWFFFATNKNKFKKNTYRWL